MSNDGYFKDGKWIETGYVNHVFKLEQGTSPIDVKVYLDGNELRLKSYSIYQDACNCPVVNLELSRFTKLDLVTTATNRIYLDYNGMKFVKINEIGEDTIEAMNQRNISRIENMINYNRVTYVDNEMKPYDDRTREYVARTFISEGTVTDVYKDGTFVKRGYVRDGEEAHYQTQLSQFPDTGVIEVYDPEVSKDLKVGVDSCGNVIEVGKPKKKSLLSRIFRK